MVHQDAAGGDLQVFVDDLSPDQVQLAAQGFLFAPLHTTEAILGQSGHLFDADDEVDIVSPALSEFDGHVAEQPLVPQVAHRLAQPVARDEHLIADLQTAEQLDRLDVRVVRPQHGDARDAVLGGDLQIDGRPPRLGPDGTAPQQAGTQNGDRLTLHRASLSAPASAWRNWSPVRPNRRSRPRNSCTAARKWSSRKSGHMTVVKCSSA